MKSRKTGQAAEPAQAKEPPQPLRDKDEAGLRAVLTALGWLTLTLPLTRLLRRLIRQGWKGLLAALIYCALLFKVYAWSHGAAPAMRLALLLFTSLPIAWAISIPLLSKQARRRLLAYALLFIAIYFGVLFMLKSGAEKFGEDASPDERFIVEFYDVPRQLLTSIFYGHDGSYYYKVFDKKDDRYLYESDIIDQRCDSRTWWGSDRALFVGVGDCGHELRLPD